MADSPVVADTAPKSTESTVQTATAPAAAGSLQTTTNFETRAKSARTPAEITALTRELMKPAPPPAPKESAPAEAPQATAPADPTPPTEADSPDAAPEATAGDTEAPAAPEGEQPAEGAESGDDPLEIPTAKQLRIRPPQDDKVGRRAAAIMQRNRDMTLEQAVDMAREQLGVKPQAPAETAPSTAPEAKPTSSLPKTIEEVDAAIKQLRVERRKANTELRFEEATDYSEKLEDLIQHRSAIERDADKQAQARVVDYNRKFSESSTKAADFYAFATDPNSPGGKRMQEIEAAMQQTEDPLYYDANKPLKIAQMVAAELNIAPRVKGAKPTPVKTAAPAPLPKPKQVLADGASRTTPPASNPTQALNERIKAAKNPYELRKLMKELNLHS